MREIIVVLHNIRSLHNVGSIFRTADAARAAKIYLCGITPEPLDRFGNVRPEIAKVALGAERTVPWERAASAARLIARLKKEGWIVCAVEQAKRSIPYLEAAKGAGRGRKIALVMGAEVEGLPPSLLARADRVLEIPMRGAYVRDAGHPKRLRKGKESLNVSVAFGVAIFALRAED